MLILAGALTLSIPGILWGNLCPLILVLFKSRSQFWVARLGLEAQIIKSCRENVSLVMVPPHPAHVRDEWL